MNTGSKNRHKKSLVVRPSIITIHNYNIQSKIQLITVYQILFA